MFNFFKRTSDATLKFYMKSGNSFVIDQVTDWNIQAGVSTENIVSLSITQRPTAKNKLIVQSIVLSQIEAIVRVEA
jgi:hypothetical protein